MGGEIYSKDDFIEFLHELDEDHDNVIADHVREADGPSLSAMQRRFGSFNNAKEAAGLQVFDSSKPQNGIRGLTYYHYIKDLVSCSVCGEERAPCIEFHHIDNKTIAVSHIGANNHGSQKVYDEIKKTIPICANCHAEHHSEVGDLVITEKEPYNYPHPLEVSEKMNDN